jgi:hypothetical protein
MTLLPPCINGADDHSSRLASHLSGGGGGTAFGKILGVLLLLPFRSTGQTTKD